MNRSDNLRIAADKCEERGDTWMAEALREAAEVLLRPMVVKPGNQFVLSRELGDYNAQIVDEIRMNEYGQLVFSGYCEELDSDEYDELHQVCPKCGGDPGETTTAGFAPNYDGNETCCAQCDWRGVVHDLVPRHQDKVPLTKAIKAIRMLFAASASEMTFDEAVEAKRRLVKMLNLDESS